MRGEAPRTQAESLRHIGVSQCIRSWLLNVKQAPPRVNFVVYHFLLHLQFTLPAAKLTCGPYTLHATQCPVAQLGTALSAAAQP